MPLGTLVRGLGVCQVFEGGIGERKNGNRPRCQPAPLSTKASPFIRQKALLRLEPSANAGSRTPVNFRWYSKAGADRHEPDSLRGRIIRSPFAIFKLTETTVGYSQDSC
jgi:hypothetical protein